MIEKVRETIVRHGLLKAGDSVVTGLSGGPDSLCLLQVLIDLKEEAVINEITAVHVNHMYRGDEALRDEEFCREFCESRGVGFKAFRFDVEGIAKETGESSEEVGRRLRYRVFRETAEEIGGAKIAVAHNREDNAETVLMRIARGTGTEGLCGIDYERDGIIRPLLDISRKEIEDFCRERGLEPKIDSTNLVPVYTRNKVRLEVIPYINEALGCDLTDTLTKLSGIAREDRDFFRECTEEAGKKALLEDGSLDLEIIRKLAPSVRKRLIVRTFSGKGLVQDISAAHLQAAEDLVFSEKTTGDLSFPRGYSLKKRYGRLVFGCPGDEDGGNAELPVLKIKIVENESEVKALTEEPVDRKRRDRQVFDADLLEAAGPIVLRCRRPGDTISPKGFSGTKKLQDYFTDRKIDRDKRDTLLLAAAGTRVIWIPGLEVSQRFLPGRETVRLAVLSLE